MITDEYLQRGIDLARNGKLLDAVTAFEEILHSHPDEPRALFNVAVLYDKLGQQNKALDLLQRSIAIDRSFANPHYYLGYLYLQMGRYKEAYQSFRNTIARDVEFTPAYEGARIAASALGLSVSDDKADVVFYTGGTTAFNGRTLEEKGLGGSESALIYVARALAANGMKVRVFCNCDKPGEYDGICYGDLVDFHLYRQLNSFPIIISSRSLRPFKIALQAQTRILWIHDDINVKYLEGEAPNTLPIDRIFAVSRWQRNEWARYFHVKQDRFFLTRNGVDLAMFKPGVKRERHRLVYISRPERGLDVLLKLFPMIRNRVPSAELHLYTYYSPGEKSTDEIWRHTQQPGVFIKGCLTKSSLA
ncbi:MAG: tetratricopeptide repeat protein, partial [Planctomycetota bacterium]